MLCKDLTFRQRQIIHQQSIPGNDVSPLVTAEKYKVATCLPLAVESGAQAGVAGVQGSVSYLSLVQGGLG